LQLQNELRGTIIQLRLVTSGHKRIDVIV